MRIVITGASGFIGHQLSARLIEAGHELLLLGRAPKKGLPSAAGFTTWNPEVGPAPVAALEGSDAIIHLAGEPVAQRWTGEAKRRIRQSRVQGTGNLVKGIAQAPSAQRPRILISGSAIGYYGERGEEVLTEKSGAGAGFLADVCQEWEGEALKAESLGLRVVLLRTGMVLGHGGGALQRMLLPFKWGIGGRIGSGEQWMSWIHEDDEVGLIEFALKADSVRGPLNLCAPKPVTNAEFTTTLARTMNRPVFLPIPVAALRILYGEMSEVIIGSQRVLPDAATKAGYSFRYPKLGAALQQILGEKS